MQPSETTAVVMEALADNSIPHMPTAFEKAAPGFERVHLLLHPKIAVLAYLFQILHDLHNLRSWWWISLAGLQG